MTASSSCQLWTALAFITLMFIDMATAIPCLDLGGICGTRQESYTYQQSYRTASYTPCDSTQFRWPGQTCGPIYRITYRTATGYRNNPTCCSGYALINNCCVPRYTCPGGCLNGGTCTPAGCFCSLGYSGSSCEIGTSVCPGGCLNGGTCSSGTCICRPDFSGSRCQIEAVVEVTLTTSQQSALNTRINSMITRMGGSFNPSRLGEEQFYNAPLIDLNQAQQQIILDSCSEASEIFAPSGRKKRRNRVCPGRQRPTSLVAWTGSGNQVGQLVWVNEQTPWAFNEECVNTRGSGPFGSCTCEKVASTSKALVMVIDVGQRRSSVSTVWKDVTIRSCAATY